MSLETCLDTDMTAGSGSKRARDRHLYACTVRRQHYNIPAEFAESHAWLYTPRTSCAQVGKANVSAAVSDDGWTPLMLSTRVGSTEKVKALLAAGAAPSAANAQVRPRARAVLVGVIACARPPSSRCWTHSRRALPMPCRATRRCTWPP